MFYDFQLQTKIKFGNGVTNEVGKVMRDYDIRRALIITDSGIVRSKLHVSATDSLKGNGIEYEIFSEVESDPSITTISKAEKFAKECSAEAIIGLGGGSSIDTAKAVAILLENGGKLRQFSGVDKIKKLNMPLIAIPTTAGTGSEVTRFAVISDTDEKFTIASHLITPKVALLDPSLTLSLPKNITAYTGIDALAHAIESYTSTLSQPIADLFALKAIELIIKNLRIVVARGDNLKARENMLQASLFAGIAFNNAFLGLCHAIASPLGAYFHIPHGLAIAVTLPYVMEYNALASSDKFAFIYKVLYPYDSCGDELKLSDK
ncbi:MAG: iron-containing alcohol dehydrogenase, partial [Candidatus Parvarchaeum sp.]